MMRHPAPCGAGRRGRCRSGSEVLMSFDAFCRRPSSGDAFHRRPINAIEPGRLKMNKLAAVFGAALAACLYAAPSHAQATRTWVSGVGDDANPCSRTAPCKTFAGAISKTAVNGEIDCLDPGGFGAVTITKSITINCDVGTGGILPGVTNAININAAGSTVTLRALDLQGVGQGINGVNVIAASVVHLVDMNIYSFTGSGVNVNVSATVFVTVEDVRIHECPNGIVTNGSGAGAVEGDFNRVSI